MGRIRTKVFANGLVSAFLPGVPPETPFRIVSPGSATLESRGKPKLKGIYRKDVALSNNYFMKNFKRMQYAAFCLLNLPTGSGCVESAIRRVINLRLKSPGIFWKRETAEMMRFLRSTLLCGRWDNMLEHLLQQNRGQF